MTVLVAPDSFKGTLTAVALRPVMLTVTVRLTPPGASVVVCVAAENDTRGTASLSATVTV